MALFFYYNIVFNFVSITNYGGCAPGYITGIAKRCYYPHCSAIALAMPNGVLLLALALYFPLQFLKGG